MSGVRLGLDFGLAPVRLSLMEVSNFPENSIILGPAGLVLAFLLTTCIVWLMMQSVGELATCYPVPSAFSTWSSQFVDRALGFATGWYFPSEDAHERMELLVSMDYCNISRTDRRQHSPVILDKPCSGCRMDFNLSSNIGYFQSLRSPWIRRNRDCLHYCQIRIHVSHNRSLRSNQCRKSP